MGSSDSGRPEIITSRANPRVARARSLRRRAERERSGLFLAEGIRIVAEAAAVGAPIVELLVAPDLLRSDLALRVVADLERQGIPSSRLGAEAFESISGKENPAGIAAIVEQRWVGLTDARPDAGLLWAVLAETQDPGNVGTVLRTADAVGAAGVILLGPTADPYDPAAVRASMGAIFERALVRAELAGLAEWKRAHAVRFVGTSDRARVGYRAPVYGRGPLAILMGSEQRGLSEEQLALCDEVVGIPMRGRGDSLNLAVATGVILYEVLAQREGR